MENKLKVGMVVRIVATREDIAEIIKSHVGWTDAMLNFLGSVGTITEEAPLGDFFRVKSYLWPAKFLVPVTTDKSNNRKTRTAYLKAERVLYRGDPVFKITGWENIITDDDLPREYIRRDGARFKIDCYGKLEVRDSSNHTRTLEVGSLVSPETFGDILASMREAGEKLAKINHEIERREAEWVRPERMYEI